MKKYEIYVEKPADWPDYIYYRDTLEEAKSLANHQKNFIRAEVKDIKTRKVVYVKESKHKVEE